MIYIFQICIMNAKFRIRAKVFWSRHSRAPVFSTPCFPSVWRTLQSQCHRADVLHFLGGKGRVAASGVPKWLRGVPRMAPVGGGRHGPGRTPASPYLSCWCYLIGEKRTDPITERPPPGVQILVPMTETPARLLGGFANTPVRFGLGTWQLSAGFVLVVPMSWFVFVCQWTGRGWCVGSVAWFFRQINIRASLELAPPRPRSPHNSFWALTAVDELWIKFGSRLVRPLTPSLTRSLMLVAPGPKKKKSNLVWLTSTKINSKLSCGHQIYGFWSRGKHGLRLISYFYSRHFAPWKKIDMSPNFPWVDP